VDIKTAVIADVRCDGKPDAIMLGSEGEKVWVGVAGDSDSRHTPITNSFVVGKQSQDSFCSIPKRIEVASLDCDTGDGTLPGCKKIKSCQSFSVVDDDCDPFNFYWDSARKTLRWWRN
jgi:hypothetical protein